MIVNADLDLRFNNFADVWMALLQRLHDSPASVSPRDQQTREIVNVHLTIDDAVKNVLVHPKRNLSYRFMVAEWLWIWFGRDDVATIAQYNRHIAQFSDNGINFNGSYGIPIKAQWPRIVETLQRDPSSRQAVIQIYRPPTGPTKDVPCTLALQFLIRNRELHVIATMRSSDVWLGLPYDVFNFSMLGNILAAQLASRLGSLSLNLGSSHLYERNLEGARAVLNNWQEASFRRSPRLKSEPPHWLEGMLEKPQAMSEMTIVTAKLPDPVWVQYATTLCSFTNTDALNALPNQVDGNGY